MKAEARQAFQKYLRESPRDQGQLKDSWQPPPGLATSWGPYFHAAELALRHQDSDGAYNEDGRD